MAQRPGCGPGRAAILGKPGSTIDGADQLTHPDVDETGRSTAGKRRTPNPAGICFCAGIWVTPRAVEPQPVVAAFDVIVDKPAPRELIEAVRTTIIEHRDGIVAAPEHDQRFVPDRARQGVRRPRCRTPRIPWLKPKAEVSSS